MKKLLAITLTLCMFFSVLVVPVSAAEVEKQLTPVASGITSNDIADNAANVGSNVVDNDASTMAIVDGYGRGIYVDLGAEYDLTKLEIVLPSEAEITAYVANNEIALSDDVSSVNKVSQIRVGGDAYSSSLTGNSCGNGGTKINGYQDLFSESAYDSITNILTYTSNLTGVRYICIHPGSSSNPSAVAEIRAYAMVEEATPDVPTQIVEKQITPVGVAFTANQISDADNNVNAIVDGDDSTMAIVDGYNYHMYIDLGAVYEVTKIEVVYPTEEAITSYLTNVTCDHTASDMNNQTQVRVGTDVPNGTYGNRINESVGVGKTGKVTTYSADGYSSDGTSDMNIRYISFTQGTSSNPTAVAEVRVYGMVEEEIAVEADITPVKVQYGVENSNLALGATITAEYENGGSKYTTYDHSYLIDNDPSTVALIGGRAVYSSSTAATPAIVILDLGEAKNLTSVKFDTLTAEEKIEVAEGLNVDNLTASNAANINNGVHVYVSNTLPTYANPGDVKLGDEGDQSINAEDCEYTLDGNTAYRYVAIKSLAGSYVSAFKGITIKDNTVQTEKLRFFFEAEHNIAVPSSFGVYIIPFAILDEEAVYESAEAVIVENTADAASLASGSIFAVDFAGIPAEAYDTSIIALPFVSFNGYNYYGTAETVTVNEVIAAQAQ